MKKISLEKSLLVVVVSIKMYLIKIVVEVIIHQKIY
jgi:hypothetical protein